MLSDRMIAEVTLPGAELDLNGWAIPRRPQAQRQWLHFDFCEEGHAMPDRDTARAVNAFLQSLMRERDLDELDAVVAAAALDWAGVLCDSSVRLGKPLRALLRAGLIPGAYQCPPKPGGRWHIPRRR